MHNHEEEGVHRMIITYIKEKEGKKSNTLFIDFFVKTTMNGDSFALSIKKYIYFKEKSLYSS